MAAESKDKPGAAIRIGLIGCGTLLLILLIIGAWQGWYWIGAGGDEEGNTSTIALNVEKDEIRDDLEGVAKTLKGVGESVDAATNMVVAEGEISDKSGSNDNLQIEFVDDDGQKHTVVVNEGSELFMNDESVAANELNLMKGVRVEVTYHQPDDGDADTPNAIKVNVVPPEPKKGS